MLVLTRKLSENIIINGNITVKIVKINGDKSVRIGIDAPKSVTIDREEVKESKDRHGSQRTGFKSISRN